jgi:hypothetical protein
MEMVRSDSQEGTNSRLMRIAYMTNAAKLRLNRHYCAAKAARAPLGDAINKKLETARRGE